jgi:hypothetical protein
MECAELPPIVSASSLPVLVVGDSVIVTRGASGRKSELGDWKQNRHWNIEVSAHEGQGYAAIAQALQ